MYRIYPLPLRLALAIWGYESLPYSTSGLSAFYLANRRWRVGPSATMTLTMTQFIADDATLGLGCMA